MRNFSLEKAERRKPEKKQIGTDRDVGERPRKRGLTDATGEAFEEKGVSGSFPWKADCEVQLHGK